MDHKCRQEIAKRWAGEILLACDTTSFNEIAISERDTELILQEVERIALKLIGNNQRCNALSSIITNVLDKYYE